MKATRISRCGRWGWVLLLAMWALQAGNAVHAQWNFLGTQWLTSSGVGSSSIALNDRRQVHVATVAQGAVSVQRFDGLNWVPAGAGLPTTGVESCALAWDEGRAWMALGPTLSLHTLDNGFWGPIAGLPTASSASNIQLRIGHDHTLWLAWTVQAAFDSAFVASNRGGPDWFVEGAFAGRLVDFELNENEDPVVLLDGASALKIRQSGSWGTMQPFYHAQERYVALAMTDDGTGTGAVVLRRDASQNLSVELLSNGNWLQLGAIGFAAGDQADLQVDLTGVVHVLSVDNASQAPPQAWRYLAGGWQLLGGQYVYNNTVSQPHLAFDGGAVFALFRDDEQSLRPSVMYLGTPLNAPEVAESDQLAFYPNPVAEVVCLRLPAGAAGATVRLCDAQGRALGQMGANAGAELALNVAHLPAGKYWLIVQRGMALPLVGSFTKL